MSNPLSKSEEPVMLVTGALAVVNYAIQALVDHGVITATQASADTKEIVPVVTSAIILGAGALVRRFVKPMSKVVKSAEEVASKAGIDLAGNDAADELLRELGLDPEGNPLPETVAETDVTPEAKARLAGEHQPIEQLTSTETGIVGP